jgi:apyrase
LQWPCSYPKTSNRPNRPNRRPQEFAERAASVCSQDPKDVARALALPEANPYFCLDLSFCHTVLTQGFDLAEDASLTLVRAVKHGGRMVQASWPLGAALDSLAGAG